MSDIISPMPHSFPVLMGASKLWPGDSTVTDIHRLCAVLEVFPYNTPVRRLGHEYRLIRDAHGGCIVTQDGVIVAAANLLENKDAANA